MHRLTARSRPVAHGPLWHTAAWRTAARLAWLLAGAGLAGRAVGAEPAPPDLAAAADAEPPRYEVHGQLTSVTQRHPAFRSPYEGENSLRPREQAAETADLTLFVGVRLWAGAAFYLNPEVDQGYGLSDTLGVAGFPSGEAYKVGHWAPYGRLPRAFLRQTFALGTQTQPVESAANALAGTAPDERVTLTLGRFSVVDLFDTNAYAHDPRADFLNWAVVDAGAFDYAADAWGYSVGAAAEWTHGDWTLRGGFFALSTEPNGESLDTQFGQNFEVVEVERRYRWGDRPGAWRVLAYTDRGRFGHYQEALDRAAAGGTTPSLSAVRRAGLKSGWAANVEQSLDDGVGVFVRVSASDGRAQAIEFTEINRSLAGGVSVSGAAWSRPLDTWGLAGVVNGLSGPAQAYFAAGGNGILIGDGRLSRYRSEQIVETYYAVALPHAWRVAADLQHIAHPAYNAERGPVWVYGLRVHAEF